VADRLATYQAAFEVLAYENQIFIDDQSFLDDAIAFMIDNDLQHEPLYGQLLKQQFMLTYYANPEQINQTALNHVLNELGTDHPIVGEIYVAINSIAHNENTAAQLASAIATAQSTNNPDLLEQALSSMARYQTSQGQYQAAIESIQSLVSTDPESLTYWHLELGYLYLLNGDVESAIANFESLLQQTTQTENLSSNIHQGLGWSHLSQKDWVQAEHHFTESDRIIADQYNQSGLGYSLDEILVDHHKNGWCCTNKQAIRPNSPSAIHAGKN